MRGAPGTQPAAGSATAVAERPAVPKARLKGHPELGVAILTGLMKRGFDPAFCMDMPKPEHGIGHAILRPAESLTDMRRPIVPVLLNCYYAPQPTAQRCYEFGKALREAIEEAPQDLRVAVVGSGGLWHTPGAKDAYLDEDFDREMLKYLEAGDIKGMAEHFDNYHIPDGDASQYIGERGRGAPACPASADRRAARARPATGSPPRPSQTARSTRSSTTSRSTPRRSAWRSRTARTCNAKAQQRRAGRLARPLLFAHPS